MVKDLKISIKEAAHFLGINYSTSKTILQLYRKTGRIDRLERKYLLQLQLDRQSELGLHYFENTTSHNMDTNQQPYQVWKHQSQEACSSEIRVADEKMVQI